MLIDTLVMKADGTQELISKEVPDDYLAESPESKAQRYNDLTVQYIRDRYSVDEELNLVNDGITDASDPEYQAYRQYVEECKARARLSVYADAATPADSRS